MSSPSSLFELHIRAEKLPSPDKEYRFHPVRKFRFDFCWPEKLVAVEIDGATWTGGRHTRGNGYENDCYKMALAISLGWSVYRFTTGMVEDGTAIRFVAEHLRRVS